MHILAVDDNEIHCYAMVRLLQAAGFKVSEAHTGKQALERAQAAKPDAVLLDINLPDVNGYEVCERLKNDPSTMHIPVVFHTATEATAQAKSHAELVGATAFLTYPVDRDQLIMVLRGAVKRGEISGQERAQA